MNPNVERHPTDEQINEGIHTKFGDEAIPGHDQPAILLIDPMTRREWAHKEGQCPRCGRDGVLFMRASKRDWRCGACIPKRNRALV